MPTTDKAPPLAWGITPHQGDRWAGKKLSCRNALYRPIEPTCWETNPIIYSPEQQSTLLCRQLGHTGRWGGAAAGHRGTHRSAPALSLPTVTLWGN